MVYDVFISHSSKDKTIADAVCATLESHRIRCWIAPRDIMPGADWGEAIIDALTECKVAVLVFSSGANDSPQVKREVQIAFEEGATVIPFRVEDVAPAKALKFYMRSVHWLDALTPPMEQHLEDLAGKVQLLLTRDSARAASDTTSEAATVPPEVALAPPMTPATQNNPIPPTQAVTASQSAPAVTAGAQMRAGTDDRTVHPVETHANEVASASLPHPAAKEVSPKSEPLQPQPQKYEDVPGTILDQVKTTPTDAAILPEITRKRWNWGAFFLNYIWLFAHGLRKLALGYFLITFVVDAICSRWWFASVLISRVAGLYPESYYSYRFGFAFIEYLIIWAFCIPLALKANTLTWRTGRFRDVEQFKAVEGKWHLWSPIGIILGPASLALWRIFWWKVFQIVL